MKELTLGKGLGLTRDMKNAIQRNSKQDEYLSTLVRQLDKEKRVAFNQLSEKKEAFIKETAKRRLSLPILEKTGPRKESLVNLGRQKAVSADERKSDCFSFHFFHPSLQNPNTKLKMQQPKLSNVSSLSFEKRHDSNNAANERDDTSLTNEKSDICIFPRLTVEKGNENVQAAQQRSFRRVSIAAASPSRNTAKILQRRDRKSVV